MNKTTIICPVSSKRVNENVVRVVAFITILVTVTGVYFKLPVVIAALAFDFYLRAFTTGEYSPIKILAKGVAEYIYLGEKPVDAAPKKFAAGIGLVFSIAIAISLWFQYSILAYLFGSILVACAGLESFFGYCLGCIIYTYAVVPYFKSKLVTIHKYN